MLNLSSECTFRTSWNSVKIKIDKGRLAIQVVYTIISKNSIVFCNKKYIDQDREGKCLLGQVRVEDMEVVTSRPQVRIRQV